jgi:hypothetical protein
VTLSRCKCLWMYVINPRHRPKFHAALGMKVCLHHGHCRCSKSIRTCLSRTSRARIARQPLHPEKKTRRPPSRSQRGCLRWRYSQQLRMPARSTMNALLIPFAYWAFFGALVQPLVPCTIETLRGISSFAFPEVNHVRRQRTPHSTSERHKIFARDCSGNRSRERSTKAKSTHR